MAEHILNLLSLVMTFQLVAYRMSPAIFRIEFEFCVRDEVLQYFDVAFSSCQVADCTLVVVCCIQVYFALH